MLDVICRWSYETGRAERSPVKAKKSKGAVMTIVMDAGMAVVCTAQAETSEENSGGDTA